MPNNRPFRFEQSEGGGGQRTQTDAEEELATLLDRLGMTVAQQGKVSADLHRLLVKYCMEVPGNIAWYQTARAKAERRFRWTRIWVLLAVIGAALALGALVVSNEQVVTAQIGTLVMAVLFILQVLASSSDVKAQVGAFWRASSDLKEALYTFEHTWCNKVLGPDGEVSPDFEIALWQEVLRARRVSRDERDAYFDTFRSPTEILNVATAPFDALRTRSAETAVFGGDATRMRKMEADMTSRPVDEARQQLIEAKAKLSAATMKLEALEAAKAPELDISGAKMALLDARADVVRMNEQLRLQAKAQMLNPS